MTIANESPGFGFTAPQVHEDLLRLARDFHAGWFLGDRERLASALHPGLAHFLRGRTPFPTGLVDERGPAVDVLDAFENLACLRLRGPYGRVLLQAIRYDRRWRVVNLMEDTAKVA